MRYILNILFFSLLFILTETTLAQNDRDKIIRENGEQFILHQIRTGETIYSLTKKYNIDRAELEKLNPLIVNGPSIGDKIKIPFRGQLVPSESVDQKRGAPDGFINYKIKSNRETAYFIAKEHGITVEDLYNYNPNLKRLKKGKTLQVPFWKKEALAENRETTEGETAQKPESDNIIEHRVASGETLFSLSKRYNIAEDEILHLNPDAVNLKAGQVLRIPQKNNHTLTAVAAPKAEFSGKYFEHIIESGETLWGTTRRFGVSEEGLKALNPILNTGFPAGAVIKIPLKEEETAQANPIYNDAFDKHFVQKGETLYGISREHGVSILELKKYNPVLDHRNLVYGETILIPILPKEEITETEKPEVSRPESVNEWKNDFYRVEVPLEIPASCQPDRSGMYKYHTYNVVLFLPLYLEANDTLNREDALIDTMLTAGVDAHLLNDLQDTTIEVERKELFKKFYGNSENFLQFYEGVLLSMEDMAKRGVNVKLHVFDTQHNADSIRQYIFDPEFLQTDLVIGPIYPDVQKEVSQIAAKNRIPLVSPLASQSYLINSNPYYFQVNPTRDYLAAETAEMVAEEYYNSNFIILKTQDYTSIPEGRLVELFQEKFVNAGLMSEDDGVNFTIYDFKAEGPFGLRRIMSKTKENVVYIPSSDEGSLSIAVSNVNNLASEYSITLIGNNRYPNYQSIQVDHFHNLKLRFIAPYWVDYDSPASVRFIERFKTAYGTEPDNFGMQGYDVSSYFMKALLAYGSDFASCLSYFHVPLIQGNYHFEKYSQFGGYMNQGVSVVEYTRDYRVKRNRVKGVPRIVVAEK